MEVVWHGHYVKYLEVARCALLDKIDYNYAADEGVGLSLAGDRYATALCRFGPVRPKAQAARRDRRVGKPSEDRLSDQRWATGKTTSRASTTQVAVEIATGEMCFASPPVLFEKLKVSPL